MNMINLIEMEMFSRCRLVVVALSTFMRHTHRCKVLLKLVNGTMRKEVYIINDLKVHFLIVQAKYHHQLKEPSMQTTFSYARILSAVGQILDQIGAKSIALHEEGDGLLVEGLNSDGQMQVQIHYTIADLYDLVSRAENQEEERTATPTAGLLYQFLTEHKRDRELVGASV